MKKLRLLAVASSVLLAATGGVLVACSDDTSVDPGGTPDSGGMPDTSSPDTYVPPVDAGVDTGTDTGTEAGVELTIENFPFWLGETLCSSLARCCYGNPDIPDGGAVDGGKLSRFKCRTEVYEGLGFEGSLIGYELADGGKVDFDKAKADECIAKAKALSCNLGGVELRAARAVCFSALVGKGNDGAACMGSMECAPGLYCKPGMGAGADPKAGGWACAPILGEGDNCSENQMDPESACSWRGSGTPQRYCETITSFDPFEAAQPEDWACRDPRPNGERCGGTTWCASGICDETTLVCVDPQQYFAGSCNRYIIN